MNVITVSAKTVNDAITEASIQLGIASTGIEYEVVEEGSAGFLGIGRKQAVIKAWKKENKPAKKEVKKEVKKEEPKKEVVKKETPKKEVKEKLEVKVKEEKTPVKEEKQVEVAPQTKEACEKFLVDVLKTIKTIPSELKEKIDIRR